MNLLTNLSKLNKKKKQSYVKRISALRLERPQIETEKMENLKKRLSIIYQYILPYYEKYTLHNKLIENGILKEDQTIYSIFDSINIDNDKLVSLINIICDDLADYLDESLNLEEKETIIKK